MADDEEEEWPDHSNEWHGEDYGYGDESYYGKGGKGKFRQNQGKGKGNKGKGKFPFGYGKGYEGHENKGGKPPKGKGKPPKGGKANVAGDQPGSDAKHPSATDSSSWNDSPYGNSDAPAGDGWYEELYDSQSGKTWYTEDGVVWRSENTASRSFIATELPTKNVSLKETSNEVYLAGIGRWQKIDCMKNATYVILDSGCTRAMGSRVRVMAFVNECRR